MKKFLLITSFLAFSSTLRAAEYQSDWDYKNFYEAVNTCRSTIVYPAAIDYEKKGLVSKQSKEILRNEMIAITPVIESIASEACYCAINEYAKDKHNADLVKNWENVVPYLEVPRCKAKMTESIKAMPQKAEVLRLK